jgi:hypothetical protein
MNLALKIDLIQLIFTTIYLRLTYLIEWILSNWDCVSKLNRN